MAIVGNQYGGPGLLGGFKPPPIPKAPRSKYLGGGIRQSLFQQQPQQQFQTPAMMEEGYDFSQDPALQRILAADAAAKSNAQAAALAAEKQLAIQLGDAKGIISDAGTAKEAANNPYSTLAQLRNAYNTQVHNTDESSNQNNLYYSGARVKAQAQNSGIYQKNQYDARQAALNALATIQANLAAAEGGASQADAAGYQNAYGNAVSNALTYGYNPGASSSSASSGPKLGGQGITAALTGAPKVNYPSALTASPAFRLLMQGRS